MSLPSIEIFRPLRRYALVVCIILWCTACVLTHLPPDNVPDFRTSDQSLHLVGFAGLTASFFAALVCHGMRRIQRIALTLIIMPVYGALDEWTQPFFGRTCDLGDWAHDVLGTLLGVILMEAGIFLILWITMKRRAKHALPKV